jgi:hypothetical protein
MSDQKKRRGPADGSRVNIHEPYELRYWTEKFCCSAEQLKAAVAAAGSSVADVRERLRSAR